MEVSVMKKMVKRVISIIYAMMMVIGCIAINPTATNTKAIDSTADQYAELAEELAKKINESRMANGNNPVYVVPVLNDISNVRASEIVVNYSHVRPDGQQMVSLVREAKLNPVKTSEVLFKGSSNVDVAFSKWQKSKAHWAIISDPNYTHIGIGIHYDPESDDKWYWALTFIQMKSFRTKMAGQKMIVNDDTTNPVSLGDVNGDGTVDSFDLSIVTERLANNEPFNPLQINAADICYDGQITEEDAKVLRMYVLGQIDKLDYTSKEALALI